MPLAVTFVFFMVAKFDIMLDGAVVPEELMITMGILSLIVILITGMYAVARLFILVEAFRTLYFLPPAAFISSWASNLPHIG